MRRPTRGSEGSCSASERASVGPPPGLLQPRLKRFCLAHPMACRSGFALLTPWHAEAVSMEILVCRPGFLFCQQVVSKSLLFIICLQFFSSGCFFFVATFCKAFSPLQYSFPSAHSFFFFFFFFFLLMCFISVFFFFFFLLLHNLFNLVFALTLFVLHKRLATRSSCTGFAALCPICTDVCNLLQISFVVYLLIFYLLVYFFRALGFLFHHACLLCPYHHRAMPARRSGRNEGMPAFHTFFVTLYVQVFCWLCQIFFVLGDFLCVGGVVVSPLIHHPREEWEEFLQ